MLGIFKCTKRELFTNHDHRPLAALVVLPSGLLGAPVTPALLFSGCSLVVDDDDDGSFPVDVFTASLVCLDVAVVMEEVRVTRVDEDDAGGPPAFDKPGIGKVWVRL